MSGQDTPRNQPLHDRNQGARGLKDADRTAGATFEHYGWKAVYAALECPPPDAPGDGPAGGQGGETRL